MKRFSMICLVLLMHTTCGAQTGKLTVTLNPFSFGEPDGGFTPGIGYNFTNRISAYADLGIIFLDPVDASGSIVETNGLSGYKIKPAFRYYLSRKKQSKGGFMELEGIYKHVNYNGNNEVDVIDNNGNFIYTYIGDYSIKKDVYGVGFKIGNRLFFDDREKLGVDVYIGIGGRTKSFRLSGLPAGARPARDFFSADRFLNFYWQRGGTVSFPAGAKLFYTF